MKSLLEAIANTACQKLYETDTSTQNLILKALAQHPLPSKTISCPEKTPKQLFILVCLKFPNPSEEEEPLIAAGFLEKIYREKNPLPLLLEDHPLQFCAKTLVSLALFPNALLKRWKQHGAPHPNFYRSSAQQQLKTLSPAHQALGAHHNRWEMFLGEHLHISC